MVGVCSAAPNKSKLAGWGVLIIIGLLVAGGGASKRLVAAGTSRRMLQPEWTACDSVRRLCACPCCGHYPGGCWRGGARSPAADHDVTSVAVQMTATWPVLHHHRGYTLVLAAGGASGLAAGGLSAPDQFCDYQSRTDEQPLLFE